MQRAAHFPHCCRLSPGGVTAGRPCASQPRGWTGRQRGDWAVAAQCDNGGARSICAAQKSRRCPSAGPCAQHPRCGQPAAPGTGRDRGRSIGKKNWEIRRSLGLMLGVGTGPWSSVKEKHPRVGRAQLCHPHSSPLPGPGDPQNRPGHPPPRPPPAGLEEAGLGWPAAPKGALSLTPRTALTRSLTRGRDLRPGLMSGMLLMQRRNLTAAPLPPGTAKPGRRKEKRKHKPC